MFRRLLRHHRTKNCNQNITHRMEVRFDERFFFSNERKSADELMRFSHERERELAHSSRLPSLYITACNESGTNQEKSVGSRSTNKHKQSHVAKGRHIQYVLSHSLIIFSLLSEKSPTVQENCLFSTTQALLLSPKEECMLPGWGYKKKSSVAYSLGKGCSFSRVSPEELSDYPGRVNVPPRVEDFWYFLFVLFLFDLIFLSNVIKIRQIMAKISIHFFCNVASQDARRY